MSKRLVVIDGKSIFYRGYYAMPNLTTSDGIALGGVYGFSVLAFNVIKKLKPDYVCVAWDKSKTNIRARRKLYPLYKANRSPAPEGFADQVSILFEVLKAFNWPLYELDDYEADDIMATFAKKAKESNLETYLVSSDLDLLQSIEEDVKIFILKQGLKHIEEFDIKAFEDKYQIKVSQFRDLKALMGDSSDNIPGVGGIGQKRATELLIEFKTLDGIYKNLDKVKPTLADKLKADKKMAYLSQQLVTLDCGVPVNLELDKMSIENLNALGLQKIFRKLEFYSLLAQIPQPMQMNNKSDFMMQDGFVLEKLPIKEHQGLSALQDLNWQKPVFIHTYCTGRFGQGLKYLLASDDGKILHLYKAHKVRDLSIKKVTIYGYDTKQACQVLSCLGIKNIQIDHDIQVAAFLLNSNRRLISLSILTADELGYISELDELRSDDFKLKAAEIGSLILKLRQKQTKELKKEIKIKKLALEIEWPFIPVLAKLESQGMALDINALKKLKSKFADRIGDLETTIYDLAAEKFNLASPLQLSEILYTKLKIPTIGIKRNKKAYSTDAESLMKLSLKYPIVDYILRWRELSKLQNTYVEGLLSQVADNGRIYSDMRLTVAATGRLSSANPNLQNIPIKTELGSLIRKAFIAPEGYKLISADYSQFELRLAAVLAEDKELIETFNKGIDIHSLTASVIFGINIKEVSKQQRYLAKTVNFGVLYGQGPHSLSVLTGMSYSDAKDFIEKYFNSRPKIKRYQDQIKAFTKENSYIENIFGRRRFLPDINNANTRLSQAAFRQAINMPIQGTEADLMKLAMVELDKQLDKDCFQIMQIHDSILVECPDNKVDKTAKILKGVLENIYPSLGIDLKVDISIDQHWPI